MFDSAPIPSFSPNTAFSLASGGNGLPEIPSLQSITDAATSQFGNLEGLTGQLGNLEGLTGQLGNLEGLASGAFSGDLGLTSIADSFSSDLNLSSISEKFDVPSLDNVFDSSQITQGLDLASSQFSTGFSQLQEGLEELT
jgi:hypothetical protein